MFNLLWHSLYPLPHNENVKVFPVRGVIQASKNVRGVYNNQKALRGVYALTRPVRGVMSE